MLRSKAKRTVYTVHYTDAAANPQQWKSKGSIKGENAEVTVFLMAQIYRMFGATADASTEPRSDPKRIRAFLTQTALSNSAETLPAATWRKAWRRASATGPAGAPAGQVPLVRRHACRQGKWRPAGFRHPVRQPAWQAGGQT